VNTANKSPYDVIIIGGALSGAGTAVLLLQQRPELRILIIEKSAAFTRRVGEATIEISTYFLTHSLGLMQYLNETQLNKQGLRFWFANEETQNLGECSEVGPGYLARVPAFLVDRAAMDEEVLRRAVAMGAELWRPASGQSDRHGALSGEGGNRAVALGGGRVGRGGAAGAAGGMVAAQSRASDYGGMVAVEGDQGLGRVGAGKKIPRLGEGLLWHARHGDEPHDGGWVVGVDDSAEGRGCQYRSGV
jgi:hypothetical protein